ncbi:MAG TPA: type IV pilus assembly protein PilM [Candidatus Saccharibacteria bacterium]|nr:type IV pilus assembly protein PilM [Candidatus Saccharibacteria bacterium]HMR38525.1 type IV pilus assembly protein PilM [Candidatus Saccharibacteria bacterium]
MGIFKGLGDFFALDIGSNAIRIVQLNGDAKRGWSLDKYAYVPVDSTVTASDSAESNRRLGEVIMTAVGQSGIKTKNVVIGLPSNKTFTTVIEVPDGTEAELKATMKYQIDQYIPMAADEAKVDWALLGPSLKTSGKREVLLTSTAIQYAEDRLEMVEGLGLNVLAAEPDPIALVRSLVPVGNQQALFLLDMGENSTDIAVVYGEAPRLIRTIPLGLKSLIKSAVQNLSVQEDQARQFILKFGLAPDRLDGQVLRAIDPVLDNFANEVSKSIKFFQTQYASIAINGMLLTGFAGVLPGMLEYLTTKSGLPAQVANPWQGVRIDQSVQTQLAPVAYEFATAVGLAKRGADK